ncbi:MAG: helix-turn-helix domain-containing protein [Azospirillaceae bacterium]
MDARARILDAAASEFAERGVHGVRMEHVARRADLNKSLVYRHFGAKDRLFDETLRREITRRTAMVEALPADLAAMLRFWSAQQHADASFIRLIAQEGLAAADAEPDVEPAAAEERRAYYRRQVDDLRALQAAGRLPAGTDPEALFLGLLLLTVGPVILPQIARLVLGDRAEGRWDGFLEDLAAVLERAAAAPEGDGD